VQKPLASTAVAVVETGRIDACLERLGAWFEGNPPTDGSPTTDGNFGTRQPSGVGENAPPFESARNRN